MFLGLLGPQGGQFFEATDPLKASTWDDWNWYLEKTFSPGGDLAALRDAVLDARRMSGDNALRAKLVLMVPFPSRESFPGTEAQKEALRLYMEQMKERYQPFAASDALELCALYWLHEDDAQEELIRYAAALTHAQGLRFLWIPFFNAHGFGRWKDLGFDLSLIHILPELRGRKFVVAFVLLPMYFGGGLIPTFLVKMCIRDRVSVSGTAQRKTFLQIGRDGFFKQKVIPFFHRRDSMPRCV